MTAWNMIYGLSFLLLLIVVLLCCLYSTPRTPPIFYEQSTLREKTPVKRCIVPLQEKTVLSVRKKTCQNIQCPNLGPGQVVGLSIDCCPCCSACAPNTDGIRYGRHSLAADSIVRRCLLSPHDPRATISRVDYGRPYSLTAHRVSFLLFLCEFT